ncbi:MAG: response regulator [Deltaproteobacteria bacterium]|nr:response regulator [Deltaproteobacteria bacterium]
MPKILVIDDKQDNLISLSALLRALIPECEVTTALSGPEGLDKARFQAPDTILLDIRMPGMDGFEVCRQLREDERTRHIPVIMLTALETGDQNLVKGLESGADAYLTKPINEYVLTAHVKTALRMKAAEDHLRGQKDTLKEVAWQKTREARKSEHRFRSMAEQISDVLFQTDHLGIIQYISPASKTVFGYAPNQMVGRHFTDFLHESSLTAADAAFRDAVEQGLHARHLELAMTRKDGSPFTGEVNGNQMVTDEGSGAVGVIRDITERKQLLEQVKAANARLEALWGVSSLAESDLKTVSDHVLNTITKMTGSAYGFYGFMNEDASAMAIHSWSGEAMKNCSMVNQPSVFAIDEAGVWGEAIRRRKPLILNDYRAGHPAKKGLPQGHVSLTNLLVVPFIQQGRILSVVAVANRAASYDEKDVTQLSSFLHSIQAIVDSKRAEAKLREVERRNQALLDHSPNCHKIVDLDFNLQYMSANGFNMLKLDADADVYGKPYPFSFFPEAFQIETRENLKKVRETGDTVTMEGLANDVDGNDIWLYSTILPVLDDDGEMEYLTVVTADTTQQKLHETEKERLEGQLHQAQKMEAIGTLAGGIAHDFNNILSPLMIHAEMALMELPSDSPLQRHVKQIYQSSERARDLVKQILTFARKQEASRAPIKASLMVKEVAKFLRSTLPSTISIQYDIQTEHDLVLGDPTELNQLIVNLSTNAAHAMEERGGSLVIQVGKETLDAEAAEYVPDLEPGSYVVLRVKDTGHGIAPEIMDKIFEPYFTTKETGKGTGIGLAVAHGIVKSYKGHITIDSEPGEGTCFTVYFPQVPGDSRTTLSKKARLQLPTGNERILFVDDEDATVGAVRPMLEALGYSVTAKQSSVKALAAFTEDPQAFDLIITDQTMPEMTGKELVREMLTIRPDLPIILCTGYSQQIDEKEAKAMGIRGFVTKPIVMREMAQTIREVLEI